MNREIKFRAWDSEQKVMFYGEKEQFDDMLAFRFGHFGIDPEENVFYMQFTGLKDKNRVNIYEGDIVSIHVEIDDPERPVDVEFIGTVKILPSIGACIKKSTIRDFGRDTVRVGYGYKHIVGNRSTIIGNIHQNPEML